MISCEELLSASDASQQGAWLLDATVLITWTDAGIIHYWVILFTIGVISKGLSTFIPSQSLITCEWVPQSRLMHTFPPMWSGDAMQEGQRLFENEALYQYFRRLSLALTVQLCIPLRNAHKTSIQSGPLSFCLPLKTNAFIKP